MTTYRAIAGTETQPEGPVTAALMTALALNPLAIGEAASGVPSSALPTVLLGTLTTTTGSTRTLSGLNLTPYKFLILTVDSVSGTSSGAAISIDSVNIGANLTSASDAWMGSAILDLSNGIVTANLFSGAAAFFAGITSYSTASTSISFSLNAGTFDAGSIRFWGCK